MSSTFNVLDFNLNQSSLIEASAGTGKTYTITYLVLRLLLGLGNSTNALKRGPINIENILIVTFTKAATSDLKLRIRQKIRQSRLALQRYYQEGIRPESEKLLNDIILELEQKGIPLKNVIQILIKAERSIDIAPICTIHSFCYRALTQIYAFEAGEAFETELVNDISDLKVQVCQSVFRKLFYTHDNRLELLNFLNLKDPIDLVDILNTLGSCVLSNPKDGFFGFSIQGIDKNEFNYHSIEDFFKNIFVNYQDFINKQNIEIEKLVDSFVLFGNDFNGFVNTDYSPGAEYSKVMGDKKFKKDIRILFENLDKIVHEHCYELILNIPEQLPERFLAYSSEKKYNDIDASAIVSFEQSVKNFTQELMELGKNIKRFRSIILTALGIYSYNQLQKQLSLKQIMSNDDVLLKLDRALNYSPNSDRLAKLICSKYPIAMIDEFQDTDPIQFSIFKRLYLHSNTTDAFCYLIGDPKQSIYAFRGSDINSYLQAKDIICNLTNNQGIYTLDTNYRSAPGVVEGYNLLFSDKINKENINPFLINKISYQSVKASSGKLSFSFDNDKSSCNYIGYIPKLGNIDAKSACAIVCAHQIKQVLEHGYLTDNLNNKRQVRFSDIAILVRNANESEIIMDSLKRLQIPCVYYSDRTSVLFEKDSICKEAMSILYLMESIIDPLNITKLKRLLGSFLLSFNTKEFKDRQNTSFMEKEVEILYKCSSLWEKFGFLAAFEYYFKHQLHNALERNLEFVYGQRATTNLYHIVELIQNINNQILGIHAQIRWFKNILQTDKNILQIDDVIKRLESESLQVKVITIHKSKGLEYPIVFMPFIFSCINMRQNNTVYKAYKYYDELSLKNVIDPFLTKMAKQYALEQMLQESRRLLYVAFTRACCANFTYILDQEAKGNKDAFWDMLTSDNAQSAFESLKSFSCFELKAYTNDDIQEYLKEEPINLNTNTTTDAKVLAFDNEALENNFSICSYTSVVSNLHENAKSFLEISYELDNNTDSTDDQVFFNTNCFNFPKGTNAGIFLHTMLEHFKFEKAFNNNEYINKYVYDLSNNIYSSILNDWSNNEGEIIGALERWLKDIIKAKLLKLDNKFLSLSDLKEKDYLPELSYIIPANNVDTKRINELCLKSLQMEDLDYQQYQKYLYLEPKIINGFVKGSLDLVFRFKEQGIYKYGVLDYKSTFLGSSYDDYSVFRVKQSVYDPRNRYDVQYLFYTLALHRYLKNRIKDYDYNKHILGVYYLYLRGLKESSDISSGIFTRKVDFQIIDALDRMFKEE